MKLREMTDYIFSSWPAKALALLAAIILFVFNRMNTLEANVFRVPLKVLLSPGYAIASQYPADINITVKWSKQSNLPAIDNNSIARYINVFVDFSDIHATGNYKRSVEYKVNELTKEQNLFIDHIEPQQITLTLEREIVRKVRVEANVSGEPADGYALANSKVNPATVILRGPQSMVEPVEFVKTEVINLLGRTQNILTNVELLPLSPLITVEGQHTIEVAAEIKEKFVVKVINDVALRLANLSPHLTLENQLTTGYLKVKGPEQLLNSTDNFQFKLQIDLTSVSWPGKFTLPVRPVVPKDVTVLEYYPDNIVVGLVRSRP